MIVWMTRPTAYEFYMGGARRVNVWLSQPHYSHQDREQEFLNRTRYIDIGWTAPHSEGQLAKFLLDQDEELKEKVIHEIVCSLMPIDLSPEIDVHAWSSALHKDGDVNWRQLFVDREWEKKCKICFKRFLLQVNLKTAGVIRIDPYVITRAENGLKSWAGTTSSIQPHLADTTPRETPSDCTLPF